MVLNAAPRLFAHPLLAVLPRSQGSERCSGNKRRLCRRQGGAAGTGLNAVFTANRSLSFAFAVCILRIHTKPEVWESALGKGREKRPRRLHLYENPMGIVGDCEGGVRARDGTLNSSMQSIVPSGPANWGTSAFATWGFFQVLAVC